MTDKTTYQFGYVEENLVVFRQTFTGDGVTKTFQLTSDVGNATFLHGQWEVANVKYLMAADATKTTRAALYDSLLPLVRHKVSVSSISAAGLVTLDYAPMAENFYIWYWYDLEGDHLEDYYRDDYVSSMEADSGVTVASGITVAVAGFAGLLDSEDTTVQKALDSLDDLAISSDYGVTGLVTAGNIKINTSQDLQAAASPTFVTVKLTGLTDTYVPYYVSDVTGLADSVISQSAGVVTVAGDLTVGGKISFTRTFADIAAGQAFAGDCIFSVTDDLGLAAFFGVRTSAYLKVAAGKAIAAGGLIGQCLNAYGSEDFDGTCPYLFGLSLDYGLTSWATGTFGYMRGVNIQGWIQSGTVTGDLTDLYIATPYSGGTVSGTHYAIYQEDAAATNYFSASLKINPLTVSRLVASDGSKVLASVANLSSWIAGTANQITVTDDGDGTATLSTPQDIHSGASPTFVTVKLTGLTDGYVPYHVADATGLSDSPLYVSGSNVGIGTTTLTARVNITDTAGENLYITRYSTGTTGANVKLFHARGTEGSPVLLNDADQTGYVSACGYVRNAADDENVFFQLAALKFFVDGVDAQGRAGGAITFSVSSGVSAAVSEKMRLTKGGFLGILTTTPQANLEVEDGGTANSILVKITQDNDDVYGLVIGNDTYSTTDTNGLRFLVDDSGNAQVSWTAGDFTIGPSTNLDSLKLDSNEDLYVTAGSIVLPASEYVNLGGTHGTAGYGFRDDGGNIQWKDSGGSWTNLDLIQLRDPAEWLDIQDDFTTNSGIATTYSTIGFVATSHNGGANQGDASLDNTSCGVTEILTGVNTDGAEMIGSASTIAVAGGQIEVSFRVKLPALSDVTDNYTVYVGLTDAYLDADYVPTEGIYFAYNHGLNAGDWTSYCTDEDVDTTDDLDVAATTNWTTLKFVVNSDASSVTFYIDGVAVGTTTTNIPDSTDFLYLTAQIIKSAGTNTRGLKIDYVNLRCNWPR